MSPWGGGDTLSTTAEVNALSLIAGDTVAFLAPYTYNDTQLVAQNNAVYTSYGTGRAKLQLPSLTTNDFVISAASKSGVAVSNLEIIGRRWVSVKGGSNLTFDNIYCHHYSTAEDHLALDGTGVFYGDYTYNLYLTVKNSIFIGGFPQVNVANDMFNFIKSSYILFENNYFRDFPHSLLGFGKGSHHIVIRGNRVYNTYHHGLYLLEDGSLEYDFVVEYNFFERSGNGQRGTNNPTLYNGEIGAFGMDSYNSIYRYNVVKRMGVPRRKWDNPGGARLNSPSHDVRVYNNVFDYPYETFTLTTNLDDGDNQLANNYIFNNAVTRGGDTSWVRFTGVNADSVQMLVWDWNTTYNPSGNVEEYNYFGSDGNNLYSISPLIIRTTNTTDFTGHIFQNNIDSYLAYSTFDAPDDSVLNYIYWVPETSRGDLYDSVLVKYNGKAPLIDAGRPHTYVSGTQTNDTLTVVDARVFFDGWNWLDGDSIKVDTFRVKILGVNTTTNKLALSATVTATDGQGIYLINKYTNDAYKGSEINIGIE